MKHSTGTAAKPDSKPASGAMKITKFTYSGPDSDGDLSFDSEVVIENTSEHVIEWIKSSFLILNDSETCIGGSQDDELDVYIDPRESGSMNLNAGWLSGVNVAGPKSNITGLVDVVACRRDFKKLGELDIPASHEENTFINGTTSLGGVIDILGVTCIRQKEDEDGDVQLNLRVGIRNKTNKYIERVQVKMSVLDQEDAQIDNSEDSYPLQPNTGRIFEPGIWGTKAGKLRNATIKVSVSIFMPVADYTAEAVATKAS